MKSLVRILAFLLFAGVGAGFGYLIGGGVKNSPLGDQLGQLTKLDVLVIFGSILPILAVHELGHLAGARLQGMRFLLFVVGPFQVTRTPSGLRFNLVWNLGTFGGLAAALPDQQKPIRPQLLSLIIGGPAASLLLAIVGGMIFTWYSGPVRIHAGFIGAFSALIFLVTAIPSRAGGFMSDGMQLLEVWRGGQAVMHRQKIMALSCQSLAGIRPREWDEQLMADIMQDSENMQPLFKVVAYHLAWMSAIDRQQYDEVERIAEWLANNVSAYPVGMRQGLTLELCLHAIRKGDLETARRWYADSKGGLIDRARRHLVDAELAFADGRTEEARKFIQSARSHLTRAMDPGVTVMTREDLDQLEARCSATASV